MKVRHINFSPFDTPERRLEILRNDVHIALADIGPDFLTNKFDVGNMVRLFCATSRLILELDAQGAFFGIDGERHG